MKVTLTKVYRNTKDKNGVDLKTKDGRPYTRVSIKTQEHGDKWLSGFGAEWNSFWNEGDTVNIEVKENGQYLNFERINELDEIRSRLTALEDAVFNNKMQPTDFGIPPEDLPDF
jgi:hypothetical protein